MQTHTTRIIFIFLGWSFISKAQPLYFPPLTGDQWDTISPSSLGWCDHRIDSMYDLLEENNTKAFMILKDGKIVLEKYFGTFEQDSFWYWASAGKSLTACLVGIAAQEGLLNLDDAASQYLGEGWTSCTPPQEEKITIRHQLTMTSGLDDMGPDNYCTIDTCLQCKSDAGSRWAYHNAPYTLLDGVIEEATGSSLGAWYLEKIRIPTGINGFFFPSGYNNVFYSKPRSMARFGLLILNKGNWNGNQILTDTSFFNSMVNTSQNLNLSYGYLWWLNGKASYMLPSLQFVFTGSLMPHAPDDMIAALGKNGQYINVVPSQNLVMIRMGNAPGGNEVPVTLNDKIWEHINTLDCTTTATKEHDGPTPALVVYPNPSQDNFIISLPDQFFDLCVYDIHGKKWIRRTGCFGREVINGEWGSGTYFVHVITGDGHHVFRKLVVIN